MKNLIQAAVVTLFAASAAHAQQAVQWKVSDGGNGHWYQLLINQQTTFWEAASAATQRGGHLVTVGTNAENAFVRQISLGHFVHFGAYQDPAVSGWAEPAAGWTWITGEPWRWSGWCPGQPDNANWNQFSGQELARFASADASCWDDAHSMQQIATWAIGDTMIEWSADCNGDGIVDYGQCLDGTLPDYNGNNTPDCCERGEACVAGNYPLQWRVDDGGNGHWYAAHAVGNAGIDWNEATAVALGKGAHLATITSAAEGEFIWTQLASNPSCWRTIGNQAGPRLGGFYSANGWQWVTGEPWNYSNGGSCFGPVHYENTLHFGCEYFENRWNDQFDWDRNSGGAILEWDADCNSDGIVDYGQILTGQLPDTNTDGIPDACQCATYPSLPGCCLGDLDHDATVGGADIGLLLSNWGPCGSACPYDLNGDDKVNGGDLGLMLASWGPCPH
jgi:hypothetical protein